MIVLDEQLLGRDIEQEIAAWYRGAVQFITDLRPGTAIKDEAIPALLRQQRQPTFVTINERDFWRKVAIDRRFCVVCFAISDARVKAIPPLLKQLLRHPDFRAKAKRMGSVIRLTEATASYYTWKNRHLRRLVF
ncbi:MAG TPA: hypothetical protein VNO70_17710 [Blastocatellia bacterium]|nr:hypothetical protein [Blastocatellia bacterium]